MSDDTYYQQFSGRLVPFARHTRDKARHEKEDEPMSKPPYRALTFGLRLVSA
jgi:hypothetical protein